jgi:TonB-linked SusC/RagA family outer membrane protein
MNVTKVRRLFARVGLLAACVAAATAAESQQRTGTISGRVTERQLGQPVSEAQVFVLGTNLGGRSGTDGRFTIVGVPAGTHRVRAVRIGYRQEVSDVTVVAGETATADFALEGTAIVLPEIVTTATGEQRRVELGNSVTNIQVDQATKERPVSTIADVLNADAPGVVVTTGTQTGTGSRIRIRGSSSLNLSNDPIYIIDGIRMTSNAGSSALFTGGAQPSRVGDLNPEEIENLEVVKGPSAATLYGTDAANGVIVVTTKRGREGPSQWNAWAEGGVLEDRNTYSTNYTIAGHFPTDPAGTYRQCTLPQISRGACVMDSVRTYNLFDDPDVTPLGMGSRNQVGLSVAGGTAVTQYYVSGEREAETGVLELPAFERRRLETQGLPLREWVLRPNALDKLSFRANLSAAITPKLDARISTGYTRLDQRFSTESNATVGVGSQAFGGPGYKNNGVVGGGLGTPLSGYRAWTPGYTWQEKNGQGLNRFIGSANANWRPLTWLTANATVGIDFTDRVDDILLFRGEGPPINSTYRLGFRENWRTDIANFTANLGGTARWQVRDGINLSSTVGMQYVNYYFKQNQAGGQDLPPGTQTAGAAATEYSGEGTVLSKTLGLFIEEQVAVRERLFVTGALRTDQNSAFGTNFQNVVYPKASVSWIASQERFFHAPVWLDELRLRAAYGASGRQPGSNDAQRAFGSTTSNIGGVDQPGVIYTAIGNPALRPERTSEFETGFEAQLFRSRASIDFTFYSKRTKDALISAVVAPSLGGPTSVRRNLGAVRNRGLEVLLSARVLDRPAIALDFALNGSTNANKLLSLGETPPQIGVTTRVVEGYPLFGFWGFKILGWNDKNGDGILTYDANPSLNEVFVDTVASFIGYNQPRQNVALTTGLELLNRRLRIQALVDFRGGHYWYNNTERIRCTSRQNCNGLMNPNASFAEQAMVVASRDDPTRSIAGYIQPGDYLRFRELAITYRLPTAVLNRLGKLSAVSLNLSARNIAHWTRYRGVDPETDRSAGDANDTPDEFQTLGPPSYLIFRVNVGF